MNATRIVTAAAICLSLLLIGTASAAADILIATNGMTLYTFDRDVRDSGRSACSWYCARIWPWASENDASGPEFGVITREGGARQLTYKGRPLYYFIGDRKPGDANGAEMDQAWHVVPLATAPMQERPTQTATR
ncbi:MAG: hypothetical protein ACJ8J7_14805 [Sulfurifustaceae bacterium]